VRVRDARSLHEDLPMARTSMNPFRPTRRVALPCARLSIREN